MKKILSIILAAAPIALYAASNIPQTPKDWYTPPNYKPPSIMEAAAQIRDQRGELHDVMFELAVDDDGNIIDSSLEYALTDIKLSVNSAIDLLDGAIIDIAQNKLDIALNNERFKTLGDNLHKVINTKGLTITSPTPDGSTHSFTINFQNGIGNDNTIQGTTTAFGFPTHDNKSLGLLKGNKYEIKGWNSEKSIQTLAVATGDIPFRSKEGANLEYRKWSGFDMSSIGYNTADQFEIKGWSTAEACGANLTKMLTDPADANRGQHLLLSKAGNALHYLPIGDVIQTNSASVVVDEKSITKITETSESGEESSKLALMGFGDAGGTKDSPAVPYSGDGDILKWQSFLTFFNGNMFESKNGKINLKGLDADENEVRILTVKAGTDGAAVTSDSMKTFIDPPLEWLNNKITVAGYNIADDNTYLKKTQTGVEWAKVDKGLLADEKAVTTNAAPFEAFTLVGFGDAKENDIPFKDSTKLNWQPITDFLDTTVDNKSIVLNDKDKLAVKGAETVSSPKKYFGTGTSTSVIGWYDLPNVTTNRIDADEVTLTTDNSADGKVKTIRWKTTPPSAPSLARMGGDGIEWIPFNDITNQNAIVGVDDVSVETNENGNLQIKGWDNQASCGADITKMLTDEGDKNRNDHEILCRVGGQIHYLPLNKEVLNIPKVDADTIIEKGDGTIGLDGSYGAEPGTVPHRTDTGLEWKKPNGDVEVDEPLIKEEGTDGSTKIKLDEDYLEELKCKCEPHTRPIADGYTIIEKEDGIWSVSEDFVGSEAMTNAIDEAINEAVSKPDGLTIIENEDDGYFSLVGSYDAEPNTMLVKDEDGNYVWMPVDNFLNDDIDGDTIIGKGDGTIGLAGSYNAAPGSVPTRTDSGLTWIAPQTMEVLTDIEWDDSTKTFKKTYKTIEFYGKVVETE